MGTICIKKSGYTVSMNTEAWMDLDQMNPIAHLDRTNIQICTLWCCSLKGLPNLCKFLHLQKLLIFLFLLPNFLFLQ